MDVNDGFLVSSGASSLPSIRLVKLALYSLTLIRPRVLKRGQVLSIPNLIDVPALLALHVLDEVVHVALAVEGLGASPCTSAPCAPSVELDGGSELAVGADHPGVGVAGVCDWGGWVCVHFFHGISIPLVSVASIVLTG